MLAQSSQLLFVSAHGKSGEGDGGGGEGDGGGGLGGGIGGGEGEGGGGEGKGGGGEGEGGGGEGDGGGGARAHVAPLVHVVGAPGVLESPSTAMRAVLEPLVQSMHTKGA